MEERRIKRIWTVNKKNMLVIIKVLGISVLHYLKGVCLLKVLGKIRRYSNYYRMSNTLWKRGGIWILERRLKEYGLLSTGSDFIVK